MTVQYAKDRVAFGRPIGSFQALKHIMADDAMYLEACKAGAVSLARAVQDRRRRCRRDRVAWSPPTSATWPIRLAQDCLQIHGGIGYTWEHDLHLFMRRIRTNAVLYGEPAWHRERVCAFHGLGASGRWARERRHGPRRLPRRGPGVARRQPRAPHARVGAAVGARHHRRTRWPPAARSSGTCTTPATSASPCRSSTAARASPTRTSGSGSEESSGYTVPAPGGIATGVTIGIIVPTLLQHASEEQKRAWIPKMLSGEEIWVQLLSEPGAGSDLAGLLTRATRDGDTWVLNGNKVWSSGALVADYGICLARTDWDAPKHKGLTWFKVPLDDPAVTCPTGA